MGLRAEVESGKCVGGGEADKGESINKYRSEVCFMTGAPIVGGPNKAPPNTQ